MARLRKVGADDCVVLESWHRVGTERSSQLRCTDRHSSRVHAHISWNGRYWELRDLNSTNGTYVDGVRITKEVDVPLIAGQLLRFGATSTETWEVVDVDPPLAGARRGDRVIWGTIDFLALPDEETAKVVIRREPDESWIREGASGEEAVADGELVEVDGETWQLSLPIWPAGTLPGTLPISQSITDAALIFTSEGRGAEVSLVVLVGTARHSFEPRKHWEMLMELAKRRLADQERGLPAAECGWMTTQEMSDWLGIPKDLVLLHAHHCRQALKKAGIIDYHDVISRRTVARKMRIGTANLTVIET